MRRRQKPRRLFVWKDFQKWKPALEGMFPDILTPELEAKVRHHTPPVKYRNDSELFELFSGRSPEEIVTADKISEFRGLYSHIRVFHGCRPVDIQSYHTRGVMLRRREEQVQRFREIFLSGRFPGLSETMLQQSIAKLKGSDPDGTVDLGLDDEWIIDMSGQFLIYGSEYLHNLVSQLPADREKRDQCHAELRRIGTPTFLLIDLPNTPEYASDGYVSQLLPDMLMTWVYNVAHGRMDSGPLDFTFTIRRTLPPEYICGCYTPPRISDPHMKPKVYVTTTGEYEDPN